MFNKVIIFHYHLLPGGVTQVIAQSIKSVLLHIPEIRHILVVTGRKENAGTVINRLMYDNEKALSSSGTTLEWKSVPEFDYLSEGRATEDSYATIIKKLKTFAGDCLWWVHNYHIGKNPLFTRALLETAETDGNQKMLFHIHDFPECSRFSNLAFLTRHCPPPLYPNLPNIRYSVINNRDRNVLISAGIEDAMVFLLHDPVPAAPPCSIDPDEARKMVDTFGKKAGTRYQSGGKLLFYPVRTIRRKNVLEAVLISRLLCRSANLIVTLPGVSDTERPYSDLVQSCFSDGLVSGLFGTGQSKGAPGFAEFTAAAHMVLSSSVQEGFGYLFLNALQWGVPLVSRYLDILKGLEEIFTGYPHMFYTGISVPISSQERPLLRKNYARRLEALQDVLRHDVRESLETEIAKLGEDGSIDFSYLSPQDQIGVIKKIDNLSYKKETQNLNKTVIESAESLVEKEGKSSCPADVEAQFGLEAFADGLKGIIDSYFIPAYSAGKQPGDQNIIIRTFAVLKNIRLLYE